ncbi:type II toxin-antitoxin system RelE/ParE family toxin [Moraxella sp. Tifton1]|uniref:type II toxin-antitoxin system RelE/ParE family toxin n=1 Tax=Moraxella oculi TaxID=2940516 RepID=UPI0020120022|nr:type II toxin-antitoxin system RelE/ParE family toxin [Moraxella sp. Tifton1]MCL1624211.1 type II toxin-antitoxin system RelE/ParE family toxin [Moraxella sp. Tifton1]
MTDNQNQEQPQFKIKKTDEFEKWFKKLKDRQAKKQILGRLFRIEQDAFFGEHKGIGDNISELKFHTGAGYRVYYTIRGNVVVLLLCAGDKDSQERDIEQAKIILANWSDEDE